MKITFIECDPIVKGKFNGPDEATHFLNHQLKLLDGMTLRAVSYDHEYDFDTKKDVWCVYIRYFPPAGGPW